MNEGLQEGVLLDRRGPSDICLSPNSNFACLLSCRGFTAPNFLLSVRNVHSYSYILYLQSTYYMQAACAHRNWSHPSSLCQRSLLFWKMHVVLIYSQFWMYLKSRQEQRRSRPLCPSCPALRVCVWGGLVNKHRPRLAAGVGYIPAFPRGWQLRCVDLTWSPRFVFLRKESGL